MIKNETGFTLPDYVVDSLGELCLEVPIHPSKVNLVIKRRNRYVSKKGDCDIPSASYMTDLKTIVVRIGRKTLIEDFRFVLAHELGHLKQHLEVGVPTNGSGSNGRKYYQPETYANKFALLTCNCYPKAAYKISKVTNCTIKQEVS